MRQNARAHARRGPPERLFAAFRVCHPAAGGCAGTSARSAAAVSAAGRPAT